MVLVGKGRLGENDRLQMRKSMSVLHEFYTNYDMKNPGNNFDVIIARDMPSTIPDSWWKFKTNLDPDDFAFGMTEGQTKSFLNKMWEIYRYRKAD